MLDPRGRKTSELKHRRDEQKDLLIFDPDKNEGDKNEGVKNAWENL